MTAVRIQYCGCVVRESENGHQRPHQRRSDRCRAAAWQSGGGSAAASRSIRANFSLYPFILLPAVRQALRSSVKARSSTAGTAVGTVAPPVGTVDPPVRDGRPPVGTVDPPVGDGSAPRPAPLALTRYAAPAIQDDRLTGKALSVRGRTVGTLASRRLARLRPRCRMGGLRR
jgi:hypothetical protein